MSSFHYPTTQTVEGFTFITDSHQEYLVYFDKAPIEISDSDELNSHTIYFGFTVKPSLQPYERRFDSKVGDTIMKIIADFFKFKPDAILAYICSDENDQEKSRQILFSKWFNSFRDKDDFIFMRKNIDNTYCGIIVKKQYYSKNQVNGWLNNFSFEK